MSLKKLYTLRLTDFPSPKVHIFTKIMWVTNRVKWMHKVCLRILCEYIWKSFLASYHLTFPREMERCTMIIHALIFDEIRWLFFSVVAKRSRERGWLFHIPIIITVFLQPYIPHNYVVQGKWKMKLLLTKMKLLQNLFKAFLFCSEL